MSSACNGRCDCQARDHKRRLRNRATGTLVISLNRTFNRVAPNHRSQNLTLTRRARRAGIEGRSHHCRRERSETPRSRLLSKAAKKTGSSALWGKIAPKPDKVAACVATRVHNFRGRESFLPGRQSAQERHAANRHGRCGGAAASYVQVCRRPVFPKYATARKRTVLKRLRQGLRSAATARYDG